MMSDDMTELPKGHARADGGQVLRSGEIPKSGHAALAGGALAQQDAAATAHQQEDGLDPLRRDAPQFHWQLIHATVFEGAALGAQRALRAEWLARQADGRTELH